jgi:hypothetical protein
MVDKTYILLTVGISLLVLTSPARAQDEQWPQYHSEREAERIIGGLDCESFPAFFKELLLRINAMVVYLDK